VADRKERRWRWLTFAALALCFLYPFPYFEELNNPNEHVRLYMTMAIVEEGTFSIDGPTARYGWVNDRSTRDGRLYAGKAPGASMLGVPVYAAASFVARLVGRELTRPLAIRLLRLLAVTVPTLLFLLWLRRFFDEFEASPWVRDVTLIAYGLGSMAYAYGMMFVGHQLAALATAGALMAFYRAGQLLRSGGKGTTHAVLGGLLLGAAPVMEYPAALAALVVLVYGVVVLSKRLVALALLTALAPVALMLYFHTVCFGSPLAFPYDFIENPAFQRLLAEGWHGALGAPSFGLFFFTPLLLFAPIGWVAWARRWRSLQPEQRHLAWAVPLASILLVLYLSSSALWRAGWAVGPRYIASAVPLLALSALWGAAALSGRWPRLTALVVSVLALLSVLHSGTSGALYPHQPEPFDNPVYDLNMPLIAMGFAPHTALEPLGLRGLQALLPLALVMLLASAPVFLEPVASLGARLRHAALVLLLCLATSITLSRLGDESSEEDRSRALVIRHWEPRGESIPERRLATFYALDDPTPAQMRSAARECRRLGQERRARALERRAEREE
jgi:hypothetical protein